MKFFTPSRLSFVMVLIIARPLYAGEVNGVQFLNDALAKKTQIFIPGTCITEGPEQCYHHGSAMHGTDETICSKQNVEVACNKSAPAQVTSASLEVRNLHFENAKATSLPEKIYLARKTIANCASDITIQSGSNLTLTGTQGITVTKTDGVSNTTGAATTLTGMVQNAGSANLTLSWSKMVSTSTSVAESDSSSTTRTSTDSVSVPPKHAINFDVLAYESGMDIPFSASIVLDGPLIANVSGFTNAGAMLSEAERTVLFKGSVRITGVSEAQVRTEDLGMDEQCNNRTDTIVHISPQQDISKVNPEFRKSFRPQKSLTRSKGVVQALRRKTIAPGILATLIPMDQGPVIQPPDGTSYEILYTTEAYKPTAECGFNDVGIMIQGIFSVEARQYRTYANGQLVSQWQESVETWTGRCWSP